MRRSVGGIQRKWNNISWPTFEVPTRSCVHRLASLKELLCWVRSLVNNISTRFFLVFTVNQKWAFMFPSNSSVLEMHSMAVTIWMCHSSVCENGSLTKKLTVPKQTWWKEGRINETIFLSLQKLNVLHEGVHVLDGSWEWIWALLQQQDQISGKIRSH